MYGVGMNRVVAATAAGGTALLVGGAVWASAAFAAPDESAVDPAAQVTVTASPEPAVTALVTVTPEPVEVRITVTPEPKAPSKTSGGSGKSSGAESEPEPEPDPPVGIPEGSPGSGP